MTRNITYEIKDLDKTAKALLGSFDSNLILFSGEIGSGKTTLIRALLNHMGTEDEAHSPSFSLVNEYHTGRGTVYHFDLYRLEDPTELWDIGFEDYLDGASMLFIEWPELIEHMLPADANKIDISVINHTSRSLKLTINKVLTENLAMTDN